jgi:uncharacterized protein (TIGR03000 family)
MRRRWFTIILAAATAVTLLAAEKSLAQYGRYSGGMGYGLSTGNYPYYGGGWSMGTYRPGLGSYYSGGYYPSGYYSGGYSPYAYGTGSYGWPSAFYTAPGAYNTGNYTTAGYTPSYFGSGYDPSYTYSPTTFPGQTYATTTGTGGYYPGMARGTGYYPGISNTQSFYPANTDSRTATINVQVPADAELWFEGEKTNQTGPNRLFRSPALEAGQNYSYDVKARWMENGKPVEQTRIVRVRAGEMSQVNFTEQGDRNTANPTDRDRLPVTPGTPGDRDRNPPERNIDRDRSPANPPDRNPANPPDRNSANPG